MYVLRYVATVAVSGINAAVGDTVFLPADRCVFATRASTGENYYVVDNEVIDFYPGHAAAVDLNVTSNVVELGYIGKSGRFVGITNPHVLP